MVGPPGTVQPLLCAQLTAVTATPTHTRSRHAAITPARAAETASTIAQLGREMLNQAAYRNRITNLVGRSHLAHAKVFADMPSAGVDLTPLMQVLPLFSTLWS